MIKHLVLVKPKVTSENVEIWKFLNAKVKDLPKMVSGIESVEIGKNFCTRSQGYDFVFSIIFNSMKDLEEWAEHPRHIPIKNFMMANADMIVMDYPLVSEGALS